MKRRQALILFAAVLFCIMLLPGFSIRAEAAEISGDWEYTLDSGIATITRYNGNATTVTVPRMFGNYLVNAIGARAFENNGTMQKVILHDRIISIGDYAFAGCVGLRSIEIPKAVVYLGWGAFKNCTNVSSITIHAKELQDCGTWDVVWDELFDIRRPFYGVGTATNGVTVTFAEGCTRVPFGLFHCDGEVAAKANLKTVKMADSVTYVAGCAFDGCDTIETVQFSNNLTTIARWAFAGCSNLKTSTLPNSVQTIEYGAFQECTSLASVTVRARTVGDYAYRGCVGLKSIVLGQNVSYLGWEAFKNCTNVSSITVHAKELQDCGTWNVVWDELFDMRRPFYGVGTATNGVTVTFAEGCTRVPFGLFYCHSEAAAKANLKTVKMEDSVTYVAGSAFDGCNTIETVQLSRNLTQIDRWAFCTCTDLKRVDFMGNAPTIHETAFNGVTTNCYYRLGYNWTDADFQDYSGDLTWNALVSTPEKPYSIVNVVSGVHVYWNSVYGVQKYGLFRSETGKNGTYKWIANPTVPHFTDTSVETGKTYYYKVTMIHPTTGKHSEKSQAIGVTYVSTPDITSRFNKAAGIIVGWNKIQGATGYAIYRKSYYGSDVWVRVATISGNSTFTWQDTSVKNANGTAYKYTVRALAGADLKTLSGCRNAGRSMGRLTSRTLNSAVKASATSIKCSWTTSSAVTGYEVRFMVGSTVYKTFTIGNYKTGVKTFTGLKAGQTYKIQVRSYKKIDGMGFYSAWSTAKNVKLP